MYKIKSFYGDSEITEEQEMNLRILADYLTSGKLLAHFDMNDYSGDDHDNRFTCGSVGCAIGHGPYAGIKKSEIEFWDEYAIRVFGGRQFDYTQSAKERLFEYCFHAAWKFKDNTAYGAGCRILEMLEIGIPEFEL